ncbi:MAG: hemerythrin domain-containing protein [Betaproteobacteria bacterium]|nr:hemerythrin domain-containing protein [Betaproteobacteria bacterium]MCC6246678.1 hemerythrin domain-containing protein [Rubrivivax sp.]MCL4699769.1 hemerythrin domain-containing protein [Burkholderiaceae bacterium]
MPGTQRSHVTPTTTSRSTTRAATDARSEVLDELKKDHQRVKKAFKRYEKLDAEKDAEERAQIVQEVLDELTLHAALEEEFLYPAARGVVDDDLLDEAEVEHESAHTAIDQLRTMSPGDEKYDARFTVLCEYVLHHVKEEEGEMFPKLERSRQLDWETVCENMRSRRSEGAEDGALATAGSMADGGERPAAALRAGSRTNRADETGESDDAGELSGVSAASEPDTLDEDEPGGKAVHRHAPGQRR